jgi:TRAP-type uncharacterized transport system substrate-binding protein
MDEKLAHDVTKATFEGKPDLAGVHAEGKNLELANQYAVSSPIPFHPGAARYFSEKGLKPR